MLKYQCEETNRHQLRNASVKYIQRKRIRDCIAFLLVALVGYTLYDLKTIPACTQRDDLQRSRNQTSATPPLNFRSRAVATGLNPRSSYNILSLDDAGDQLISTSITHASCTRLCESEPGWIGMPVFRAVDVVKNEEIRELSGHFEYLTSLGGTQGWNTSTWRTGDKRQWECNYICEIPHAFVDANGRVCAVNDGVCLIQQDCLPLAPDFHKHHASDLAQYDKVLVISQNWGESVYHAIMENAIKLGDVLDVLSTRKDVHVHVPGNMSAAALFPPLLSAFGIETSRLVYGPLLANYLIYPRATKCGDPSVRQLLKFRQAIERSDCYRRHAPAGQSKDHVLLIKREPGKPRSFVNHEELRNALAIFTEKKSLKLREFGAPPQPRDKCGIIHDMLIFKQSRIIVAPHGAGLLNLLLCDPGTIVLETHTSNVNHVFTRMSMSLGLRHLSLFDSNAKIYTPMTANVSAIVDALHAFM